MLTHLSIRGLAIVDSLELSFGAGLTALTGETGAGKSIVVDALSLIAGERARPDVIRNGVDECEIGAQFHVDDVLSEALSRELSDEGLPPLEDGALLMRRILSRGGRHRQYINGCLATVAQLKSVASSLIDFTGQHAQQALLRPKAQLFLLDAFGDHGDERAAVEVLYEAARALASERESLQLAEKEKTDRADYLRFQLDEITSVDPIPGEEAELQSERTRLQNVDRIQLTVANALSSLSSDDGDDALTRLHTAAHELSRLARDVSELQPVTSSLEEAATLIDDAVRELRKHADAAERDPERLSFIDDRLDALRKLERKHGPTLERVVAARAEMDKELARIDGAEARLAVLDDEVNRATQRLAKSASTLSAHRRASASNLEQKLMRELSELGMPAAKIIVDVAALDVDKDTLLVAGTASDRCALTATGQDRVEFLLAANPGEPPGSMAKIASGGELSRILLALKRVLLEKDPVPLSIFDEVDTGTGGAIAEVIAEKLRAIADGRQVITVTHLAQVAAFADTHLSVSKSTDDGRTSSHVNVLDDDARAGEIARMIGGRSITKVTSMHAEEMLARGKAHATSRARAQTASTTTATAPEKPRKSKKRATELEA